MSSAGQQLVAGRVPGERIATTISTAASSNVTTTETKIDTVVASLVSGRIYRITWDTGLLSSVAGDSGFVRIREDDGITGTQLQLMRINIANTGGSGSRWPARIEAEYTAASTGSKTFSATLIRATGTGNVTTQAAATYPAYLYVDYIRG